MNNKFATFARVFHHSTGIRGFGIHRIRRPIWHAISISLLLSSFSQFAYSETPAATSNNSGWNFSAKHGMQIRSKDGAYRFSLGGRLHADTALFNDDLTRIENDSRLRRLRLTIKGRIGDRWRFKAEMENAPGRQGVRNLWLKYRPSENAWLKVGNIVAPFGLEDVSASNHSVFMERSISAALAPSFQTAVGIGWRGSLGDEDAAFPYTASFSAGRPPMGKPQEDSHNSQHTSVTSRFTIAAITASDHVFHAGMAIDHRSIREGSYYSIRSRPESSLGPALLNTRLIDGIDAATSVGIEAATILGPFSAQGEFMRTSLSRLGESRAPRFDGWYAQMSYAITGEHRRYSRSTGTFRGLRPNNPWGALEIAFRVSHLDLDDEFVQGGVASNFAIALNWYVKENLRLMLNYVSVDAQRRGDLRNDRPKILQARFLLFF